MALSATIERIALDKKVREVSGGEFLTLSDMIDTIKRLRKLSEDLMIDIVRQEEPCAPSEHSISKPTRSN